MGASCLTHWGRETHICVSKLTIIGSDNGLSPCRRQAIIWTNAGILLIGPLGTNFNEMLIEILTFSFMKVRLKVSSAKRRPFCLGPNVLIHRQLLPPNRMQSHYTDVIMGTVAPQMTSLTIVYSTVYSDADQRKHQSFASLAFVWGIHRTGEFPAQRASYAENVSIWWRHHVHNNVSARSHKLQGRQKLSDMDQRALIGACNTAL